MTGPIHPTKAEEAFRRYLATQKLNPEQLTVSSGVGAMLTFFEQAEFSPLAAGDPDMLLFQWGTYDWGEGPSFELDITRQLIWPCDDGDDEQELWQLSLRFRFVPDEELAALGNENRWCENQDELPDFRRYIHEAEAYRALTERTDAEVEITFGSAE